MPLGYGFCRPSFSSHAETLAEIPGGQRIALQLARQGGNIVTTRERLISVVICTRNRADLLGKAIASVVDQEFPRTDYEIIIVDNGSTDRTPEVVRSVQGTAVVRYIREERIGLCIARNRGWRAAFGRYVAFFDDDAIAQPGWLKVVRDAFESIPDGVGVVGGDRPRASGMRSPGARGRRSSGGRPTAPRRGPSSCPSSPCRSRSG